MLSKSTKKGLLFILSAPAGTGKTTLIEMLKQDFSNVQQSVSFTTRDPRPGEIDGVHYFFIATSDFEQKIKQNEFLEYVKLYGTYYGTSVEWVDEKLNSGKDVFLVIDTQGCFNVLQKRDAISIFIEPPSIDVLKKRLTKRSTETQEAIEKRLSIATREIADGSRYDYKIINDKLDDAYVALKSIYIAEQHKNCKKS